MSNELSELKESIDTLNESVNSLVASVDRLHAIQHDIFNTDTSHDDIVSLKNKMQLLIDTINMKMGN